MLGSNFNKSIKGNWLQLLHQIEIKIQIPNLRANETMFKLV